MRRNEEEFPSTLEGYADAREYLKSIDQWDPEWKNNDTEVLNQAIAMKARLSNHIIEFNEIMAGYAIRIYTGGTVDNALWKARVDDFLIQRGLFFREDGRITFLPRPQKPVFVEEIKD